MTAAVFRSRARKPLGRVVARASAGACVYAALIVGLAWHPAAQAQTRDETGDSLLTLVTTLSNSGVYQYNGLERAAAAADDAAFLNLQSICGSGQNGAAPAAGCKGNTLLLFDRLRELEDNANELLGRGETTYSLHLDPQDVGFALRWTAPEEFAAQGSMASKFANGQSFVLQNRFAALRLASQGLRVAQSATPDGSGGWSFAYNGGDPVGGGASGDSSGSFLSRWSIFANAGYGAGDKAPTTFEDAFAFDGTEVSVGADVRLTNHLVIGLLAGHTEQRVDFNSSESIVDGGVRGNGQSVLGYLQLEGESAFINFSFGAQHLSLATRRRITYPSNNPTIPSVDETSYSNTGSTAWIGNLGGGYTFRYRGFSGEPYLNFQWVHTRIAGFTEHSGDGFDFDTGPQTIQSAEGSLGVKFQYALLGSFGVLVPYVYGEVRRQFRDGSRDLGSAYASATAGDEFELPTDEPTRHYYAVGGGGSIVLKHGLQGFIQYVRILQYANYTDHVVSGGIRWEL